MQIFRNFVHDDRGVTDSMSLALVLPFYTVTVALAIEVLLLMHSQILVDSAAVQCARAVSVWRNLPADPQRVSSQIQCAAAFALVPTASSLAVDLPLRLSESPESAAYLSAVKAFGLTSPDVEYYSNKIKYALAATSVDTRFFDTGSNGGEAEIRVEFRAPIHNPLLQIFLADSDGPSGRRTACRLVGVARCSVETPVSFDHTLGIGYRP